MQCFTNWTDPPRRCSCCLFWIIKYLVRLCTCLPPPPAAANTKAICDGGLRVRYAGGIFGDCNDTFYLAMGAVDMSLLPLGGSRGYSSGTDTGSSTSSSSPSPASTSTGGGGGERGRRWYHEVEVVSGNMYIGAVRPSALALPSTAVASDPASVSTVSSAMSDMVAQALHIPSRVVGALVRACALRTHAGVN